MHVRARLTTHAACWCAGKFADLSSVAHGNLVLMVRTATPDYAGFRVSFAAGALSPAYSCAGGGGIPLSRGCFKTNFTIPAGDSFTAIRLPFSSFSDEWSSATGPPCLVSPSDSSPNRPLRPIFAITFFATPRAYLLAGSSRIESRER